MTDLPDRKDPAGTPSTPQTKMVVICGPTATGKSDAAIALAERADGEIIGADSVQVYRGLDIGSAKPSSEDRQRVPHHLIDVVEPDQEMTAARYTRLSRQAVSEIRSRGKSVVVAGGTGPYIKALVHGLSEAPGADPALREELQAFEDENGPGALHKKLSEVDPDTATRLHPSDLVRVVRALEVWELVGTPLSELQRAHGFKPGPYDVRYVGIDPGREELNRRIEERVAAMVDAGLLEEVRRLKARGYGPKLRPLKSPGYRQMFAVLGDEMTLAQAFESICTDHRRYARRQRVWFRGVEGVKWVRAAEDVPHDALAHWLRQRSGTAKG